jgi:type II secretory pathway component GspD/PulD (secretin)
VEKKLNFNFKDASLDTILRYVSSVTGWIFVQEKATSGTITAVSDTDVPVSKCLDFLNSALRQHGRVILNPYSPALPRRDRPSRSGRLRRHEAGIEIYVGRTSSPSPLTDQVRTQIIPLKAVNVVDVAERAGRGPAQRAGGTTDGSSGTMAVSTYSNSIILTADPRGSAARPHPAGHRRGDVRRAEGRRSIPLKNADATETAKTLNEVFKRRP